LITSPAPFHYATQQYQQKCAKIDHPPTTYGLMKTNKKHFYLLLQATHFT